MATTTATTFLDRQVTAYGDGWPAADHAEAMACRDLEERLEHGMGLYRLVAKRADEFVRGLDVHGASYDLPVAEEIERLLNSWLAPAAAALAAIESAEQAGFTVAGATEFRDAVQEARISTSVPAARVAARAKRRARDGQEHGGKTTEEMRRELLARVGA